MNLETYKSVFLDYLENKIFLKEPKKLYEPITYILNLGGKRLRPILALIACDAFGTTYKKALPASLAIEVFHNFTLIHDDIMDHATIRRGKHTVHEKWNINTGILSGDAMLLMANKLFEAYDGTIFKELMSLFNKTALEVCEGQQYDINFETQENVTIADYLKMITSKTAVLVACSLKMGAIIAKTSKKNTDYIYEFGLNLGIAFQLQDDYLDTFGDTKTFGKKIGGDIIENKKTFLYLKLLKLSSLSDKEKLLKLYTTTNNLDKKINEVSLLYRKYKIPKLIKVAIKKYTDFAYHSLSKTTLSDAKKSIFIGLTKTLLNRID
ncbi:MAG: polyprenyl synthetase family protein [Flavobacteriaceae bacterium]|nr:polyprenyl synthetase family protein [Flavobacteriaceae bacterium]